jgi:hypothetical protein
VVGRRAELNLLFFTKSLQIYTEVRVTTRAPTSIAEIVANMRKRRADSRTPHSVRCGDFWKVVSVGCRIWAADLVAVPATFSSLP